MLGFGLKEGKWSKFCQQTSTRILQILLGPLSSFSCQLVLWFKDEPRSYKEWRNGILLFSNFCAIFKKSWAFQVTANEFVFVYKILAQFFENRRNLCHHCLKLLGLSLDYLQNTLKNNMTLSLVLAFCKKNGTLIRVIDTLPWLMMWEKFQNWVLLVEKGKTFLTWITKKCNVKCGMS